MKRAIYMLTLLAALACSSSEGGVDIPSGELSFDAGLAEVGAAAGEHVFVSSVSLSGFSASSDAVWCSAAIEGNGVVVRYTQNNVNATRQAVIAVTDAKGRGKASLSLLQSRAVLGFAGSVSKVPLDARGSAVEVEVESDAQWEAGTGQEWLHAVKADGRVILSADANPSSSPRQGTLTLSVGEITRNCTVEQEGVSLVLAESSVSLPAVGGEISIAVASNADWTVSGSASWVDAVADGPFIVLKASGNSSQQRSATLEVRAGEVVKKLTVRQDDRYHGLAGSWVLSGAIWLNDDAGSYSASLHSQTVSLTAGTDGKTLLLHGFSAPYLSGADVPMTLIYDSSLGTLSAQMNEQVYVSTFISLMDGSHDGRASVRTVRQGSTGSGSSLSFSEHPGGTASVVGDISSDLSTISFPLDEGWGYGIFHYSDGEWTGSYCSYRFVGIVLERK